MTVGMSQSAAYYSRCSAAHSLRPSPRLYLAAL